MENPDNASKSLDIAKSAVFKRNAVQYPMPIALACQKILEEKEILAKLTAIFDTYESIISYVNALVLSLGYQGYFPLKDPRYHEMAGTLEVPDFDDWFQFFREAMQEVKSVPLIEELQAWYRKVEKNAGMSMREIDSYREKTGSTGYLTALYEIRRSLLPALPIMTKEEKQKYFERCWEWLEKILLDLQFLKAYPLCYIEKILHGNKEVLAKRLMGSDPSLDQITLKHEQNITARQNFLYDEGNGIFYPLYPMIVYQECYYCLREKQQNPWELFVFQGKSASRLHYKGRLHKVALKEPLKIYVQMRQECQKTGPAPVAISIKDIWEHAFHSTQQQMNDLRKAKILQSYYPRKIAENALDSFISNSAYPLFMLIGGKGIGKTTLLAEMAKKWLAHGQTAFFFRLSGQREVDIQEELERVLGANRWQPARKLAEDESQEWIVILDSLDNLSMPKEFFANLSRLVRSHRHLKVIMSLSEFCYRSWENFMPRELFMPSEGACPIIGSSLPYLRLENFSPAEVKEAYSVISQDVEGSTPSFSSIPKKTRGVLRNPSVLKIFLWCLRNQEVPRYLSLRDIMEGFVMNYINYSQKRREFIERFSVMLTNTKPLPVTMEMILAGEDMLLLNEILCINFPSGFEELLRQGILERKAYYQREEKSYAIDFPLRILQEYTSYRAVAVEGKHRDDLLANYLTDIVEGNYTLWGVAYFAMLRLVDKQYCDRFVDIMKRAPSPSSATSQILYDILVVKDETGSQPYGSGGYLDTMINNLLSAPSQEVFNGIFMFADYLFREEKYAQAAQLWDRITQCNINFEFRYEPHLWQILAAWSYLKAKDAKRAAKLYKKATKNLKKLENSPYEFEFYILLARGYGELGELDKAREFLHKCAEHRGKIKDTVKDAELYEDEGKLAEIEKDYGKALEHFQRQHEILEKLGREDKLANAMENKARILSRSEDRGKAVAIYEEASQIYQDMGFRKQWATCQQKLANVLADIGETQKARGSLLKCLEILEALEEKEILARTYLSLGHICARLKKQEESLEYFQRALDILTELENENGMAQCYEKFGIIYLEQSKFKEAQDNFKKALKVFEKNENKQGIGDIHNHLGNLYKNKREFTQAGEHYRESFKVRQNLGDLRGMAEIYANLAEVAARNKSFNDAVSELEKGKNIYKQLQDRKGIAQTIATEALIFNLQGENTQALDRYEECAKMLQDIKEFYVLGGIYNRIGLIYQQRGNLYEALSYFEKSGRIQQEIGDLAGLAATYNNIGLIHDTKNEYQKALEYYTKDLEITERLGDKKGCATSYNNIGMLHLNHAYYARALWFFEKAISIYKETGDDAMVKKVEERIQQVKEKL